MRKIALAITTAALMLAQTPGSEKKAEFEVASVKPKNPNVVDEVELVASGRRLTATNLSLQMLLAAAHGVDLQQVAGGPEWLRADRFNIVANAPEDFADDGDRVSVLGQQVPRKMMLMLQALLADRFRVQLHREMKESTTYDLVIARGGPKLHETKDREQAPYLGLRQGPHDPGALLFDARRASMQLLAERLNRTLRAPVADRTGITGEFDFQVEFYSTNIVGNSDAVPSIFTALQEQLGLRLEAKKGSVETVVIDHAERPSVN